MTDENNEPKRISKLSSLLEKESEDNNGIQITVYYSENNWETCDEINLILDETATINQLIDSSIYKFKSELFFDNIDKKQFKVMLFKKKIKRPNEEYPICNPESKVKDYGKTHFCLVEDIKFKDNQPIELIENKPNNLNINIDVNNKKNANINDIIDKKEDNEIKGYKTCKDKCFGCYIY